MVFTKRYVPMVGGMMLAACVALPSYAGDDHYAEAKETMGEMKKDAKHIYEESKQNFANGWVVGKLESTFLLNEHLSSFDIDVDAEQGTVFLSGKVESGLQKDLAENIALGMDGVKRVENNIMVDENAKQTLSDKAKEKKNEFVGYVQELSTTAAIKTELLANENVKGLAINVDTEGNEVVLSGKVKSEEQKELVEAIAEKKDGVKKVVNKIEVASH